MTSNEYGEIWAETLNRKYKNWDQNVYLSNYDLPFLRRDTAIIQKVLSQIIPGSIQRERLQLLSLMFGREIKHVVALRHPDVLAFKEFFGKPERIQWLHDYYRTYATSGTGAFTQQGDQTPAEHGVV